VVNNTRCRSMGREEGRIMRGMGGGAVRKANGKRSRSGAGNCGKRFPRLQRFPAPRLGWDQRWEPLMSGTAEGGGERRGGSKRRRRDSSEEGGF